MSKFTIAAEQLLKIANFVGSVQDAAATLAEVGRLETHAAELTRQIKRHTEQLAATKAEADDISRRSIADEAAAKARADAALKEGERLVVEAKVTAGAILEAAKTDARARVDAALDKQNARARQIAADIAAKSALLADLDIQMGHKSAVIASLDTEITTLNARLADVKGQIAKLMG